MACIRKASLKTKKQSKPTHKESVDDLQNKLKQLYEERYETCFNDELTRFKQLSPDVRQQIIAQQEINNYYITIGKSRSSLARAYDQSISDLERRVEFNTVDPHVDYIDFLDDAEDQDQDPIYPAAGLPLPDLIKAHIDACAEEMIRQD